MLAQPLFSRIRALFAAALVAGLIAGLGAGAARPQPAQADFADVVGDMFYVYCKIITYTLGCQPFGTTPESPVTPPPACDVRDLTAQVAGSERRYGYVLACNVESLSTVRVAGTYDTTTRQAREELTQLKMGGGAGAMRWTCPVDPWGAADATPDCAPVGGGAIVSVISTLGIETPFSALFLDPADRALLAARLAQALKDARTADTRLPGSDILATPRSQSPAPAPMLTWPTLRLGAQGETVRSLQYLLRQHGVAATVDGDFGPQTAQAVRAFQQAQKIGVDGVVGPQTWARLAILVRRGNQGDAVRAIQSQLAARGTAISVDGDFGQQTETAVRAYQQAQGLGTDGIVGPQTWNALLTGR